MKTFLDSGVLLAAWKGKGEIAERAAQVMDDPARVFVTCEMVKLELLPKPLYFRQKAECEFYQTHFDDAAAVAPVSSELFREAFTLAASNGLAAADAVNLAAALRLGAAEFITSESPGKPLFRVSGIRIRSLEQIDPAAV